MQSGNTSRSRPLHITALVDYSSRMKLTPPIFALTVALAQTLAACAHTPSTAPATAQKPVNTTYHGVDVAESYRWLERSEDPQVQAWTEAQNAYTRQHLDALPGQEALRHDLEAVLKSDTATYYATRFAAGLLFAEKHAPPKQQSLLVVTDNTFADDAFRVLLDPNVLDPSGATSIDWYTPSHDGKMVAVSLSTGGTESGDVHIYDVVTAKRVHEVITRVNGGTAGGDLAWSADNSGFFYTRYPRGDERPETDRDFYQQLWYHQLGDPAENDRYEIGKEFPRIAEIEVRVDAGSGRAIATVQDGDGGEFAHYLRGPGKGDTWKQFSKFGDKIIQATFATLSGTESLLLLSRAQAPKGKILHLDLKTLATITELKAVAESATVLIPEAAHSLVNGFWGSPTIVATESRVFVVAQLGGPSAIIAYDHAGISVDAPEQLPVSDVSSLTGLGGDALLFINRSFLEPPAAFRYDVKTNATRKTVLQTVSPVKLDDIEVVREMATSKDGTQIPVNIIKRRDIALDGSHALILYGYGGYGVNITPRFSASNSVLLNRGVIYAIANIRGGGEYGEDWHRQGNLTLKQNVFDDFAAAGEHLINRGYTSSERLGLRGGSNGGLLMGATMVQKPELAKVVVSHVGIYDMLRVELSPNGAFNVTEFGTVKDPEHFKALHAYSPYHNVLDKTPYPAVLMMTGSNDPRVDPMHSRKMIARLQAANGAKSPVLLRTSFGTGHGGGTPLDEQINQLVDEFSFYLYHLGVTEAASQAPGA